MKNLRNFLLFTLFLNISNTIHSNTFLDQTLLDVIAGSSSMVLKNIFINNAVPDPNFKVSMLLAAYVGVKFFYDTLNANSCSDIFKSSIAVPYNAAVSFGSFILLDSIN